MELANQNQIKNPLDDDLAYNEQSAMNLELTNNEYSIELDPDTITYLTMKKKTTFEDENEMRMNDKIWIYLRFLFCFYRTNFWK